MSALSVVKCILIGIVVSAYPATSWSQDILKPQDIRESQEPYTKAFTLYWENDSFTGTDRDYTNGLKLTWSQPYSSPEDERPGIKNWMMNHLPLMNHPDAQRATSLSVGQNIYTPEDTTRTDVVLDDRPYAGFSYLGFGFLSNNARRRDVWEINVGLVGPLSQAESAQDWVHDLIDAERAQGWDNQLENEIGLELICETKWRLWHTGDHQGFGVDLIPHLGGRIGNIATYASTGAEVRLGWLMPQDFGTCPIRPGCDVGSTLSDGLGINGGDASRLGIHFFAAFEARAVLRDIFLDGNTFQDSHSVDKELLVADLMGGIAVHYNRIRMNYTYVLRTREFEQQDDNHAFGAVSLTYVY